MTGRTDVENILAGEAGDEGPTHISLGGSAVVLLKLVPDREESVLTSLPHPQVRNTPDHVSEHRMRVLAKDSQNIIEYMT